MLVQANREYIHSKQTITSGMCGRYTLTADIKVIEKRFDIDATAHFKPRYNAAPTQLLPIITNQNTQGFSFFYWGMIPRWSKNKNISNKLINARAETITEKVSFKNAFKQRRCLIPADGFYEWKNLGKKQKVPYRILLKNTEPFAFAGLWEEFEDEKDNVAHTFTIVTTAANNLVHAIHDRMPVILPQEAEQKWLDDATSEAELLDLLKPYPANDMDYYTVSPSVNTPANDYPELVKHTPPADQHGNYTLFN